MCLKEDKVITQEIEKKHIYIEDPRDSHTQYRKWPYGTNLWLSEKKSSIDRVRLSHVFCVCMCVYLHGTQLKRKERERVNINYSMRISDWTKQLKLLFQRTSLLFPRIHSSMLDIISLFLSYWAFLVDFYYLRYRGTMCVYAVYIWGGSRDLRLNLYIGSFPLSHVCLSLSWSLQNIIYGQLRFVSRELLACLYVSIYDILFNIRPFFYFTFLI